MATVFVVDDDPAVTKMLGRVLEADGHHVQAANGPDEAEGFLDSGAGYDVALLDFWLGKKNALDLLKKMRTQKPAVPVIFFSGGGQDVSLEVTTALAEMEGVVEFLYKPIGTANLRETVRRLLPEA